jgi:YVTN family beta-propeller protein
VAASRHLPAGAPVVPRTDTVASRAVARYRNLAIVVAVFAVLAAAWPLDRSASDEDAVELDPVEDTGFFPGPMRDLAPGYVARTNTVQSVGAPLPPDGDEWSGRGWIFVAAEVGRGIAVHDLETLAPVAFIYSEESAVPHHPYLSPDQRWVVANARFGNEVIVVDTHDDFATDFLAFPEAADGADVAGPLHGTFTSDSRYFIVALQRSDRLGVIDMEADGGPAIAEVIDVGDRPRDVYITPDDEKAFFSMQGADTVGVLDIGTWELREIDRTDADYADAGGGGAGMSVDGELLAISNTPEEQVIIIDTATEEVVHRVAGVPNPVNAEFLGDTHIVGTGNRSDGSASFIDADTGELLGTVETGGGANIPYLGPDGNYWVSHNGAEHVSVIDPDTLEVIEEVGTGVNPHWIHFLPSGSRALATNWGENSVTVIDVARYETLGTFTTGLNPNGIVVKTDVTAEQAAAALERHDTAGVDVALSSEMVLPPPEDEQEALFLDSCVQCHDVGRIVRNNASTEEEWTAIVERMIGNGAQISDVEATDIIDYLTEGRQQELEFGTRFEEERETR